MSAQGLGAFAAAVGHLGLDGATALCETRDLPAALLAVFDALGYTVDHLPSREDVELVLIGVEIKRRQTIRQSNKKPHGVHDVIDGLCDAKTAVRSAHVLESFGLIGVTFHKQFTHAAMFGAF